MIPEIVVLASGGGSNFQSLIDAIESGALNARIRCLIVDRDCGAIARAKQHKISYFVLDRYNHPALNLNAQAILCHNVHLIVCAGYLSILPNSFLNMFANQVINIHPSLLPKYGGKGMYGLKVHDAVIRAGEKETGCTVHRVDSGLDTGEVIAQEIVEVSVLDTPESLQKKVLDKEHQLLPETVKRLLNELN
ncbi:phosphoribosylglycinamide formyltransferase [Ostreibacterium oceani]|uniref:Phosphoribosylglycinamide formyltransferase n=1 Tax=Ostreibacterium oceani TaxID=2654998 RepID=A0A6N7EW95_9GAMM|nr:phosphoribosylglycinamide formyltransferase [Ostreibacterium oceani]MPV86173.1 phosphoribosylglycinamide formyltransferase [Ostreibacterium oceani]